MNRFLISFCSVFTNLQVTEEKIFFKKFNNLLKISNNHRLTENLQEQHKFMFLKEDSISEEVAALIPHHS